MTSESNWRKKADELLAAPPRKKRDLSTVAGKVEDRFEAIYAARQRGMAWKDIAAALENGKSISVDAVESAFMRICKERGINSPRKASTSKSCGSATTTCPQASQAPEALEATKGPEAPEDSEAPETVVAPVPPAAQERVSGDHTASTMNIAAGLTADVDATSTTQSNLFDDDDHRWVDDGE